jgi:hypothetical protein
LVWGALRDLEHWALPDKEKALLRFVEKVNRDSPNIVPAAIEALHDLGRSDEALYYATTVCALFGFYHCWIDASGVTAMSPDVYQEFGIRTAKHGYVRKQTSFALLQHFQKTCRLMP